ncbi:MAG: hypothetical protein AAF802_28145 [Planctomycetota bacterium]
MSVWIDRFLLLSLLVIVVILTITSVSALGGEPLGGNELLAHMMASGVLVVGLPVFAIAAIRHLPKKDTSTTQGIGVLLTITTGLLSIVTVFLCMLPIASTDQMHTLIKAHRWAGLSMIPSVAILMLGMTFTRSASRPRS